MPALHESARRKLCRLVFVFAVLGPSLGIAGWGVVRRRPGAEERLAATLSIRLGLQASIETLEEPRPGVWLLRGVSFCERETGTSLLRCRLVEVTEDETWRIVAYQPEMNADGLPQLWQAASRLLRGEAPLHKPIDVAPCDVTLLQAQTAQTYNVAQASVSRSHDRGRLELEFKPAGTPDAPFARLILIRTVSEGEPVTSWKLTATGAGLPCSLFRPFLDLPGRLGPKCVFSGTTARIQQGDRSQLTVQGSFGHIQLRTLIASRFVHSAEGEARLTIRDALVRNGRLLKATGTVTGGPGAVGRSLLAAAVHWLGCEAPADALAPNGPALLFDELAFDFELDEGGLSLNGIGAAPRAMLVGRDGSPLLTSGSAQRTILDLVRAMAPPRAPLAPADAATSELLWVLRAVR